jgi:hypothetical protein
MKGFHGFQKRGAPSAKAFGVPHEPADILFRQCG